MTRGCISISQQCNHMHNLFVCLVIIRNKYIELKYNS